MKTLKISSSGITAAQISLNWGRKRSFG